MNIEEQKPLAPLTTFGVGGPATYYARVTTVDELEEALAHARENQLPVFILGGGSNVVIDDAGLDGLVIHCALTRVGYEEKEEGQVEVVAGAGERWDELVADTVNRGLWGLENLSGIPGSVGAAPVQNIGAYGVEIQDVLEWVEAVDIETGEKKVFSPQECEFAYRWSYFKSNEGRRWVIARVAFRLAVETNPKLSYKDLQEYFTDMSVQPSLAEIREAVLTIRAKKFPDLTELGTAGSFFTNPIISRHALPRLLEKYPELPHYEVDDQDVDDKDGKQRVKVSAAWILDKACGLKGYHRGPVRLFERQPLVVVAERGATAADIHALADDVQKQVQKATGITLAREVRYLPEE